MSNARLLSLTLERFKSYEQATEIPLSPVTVVLGRNNSGKSSIIQALLLLKQTLALPRPEVPLHLQGALFEALHLREITSGWPAAGPDVPGPRIGIRWVSLINREPIETKLVLDYAEQGERTVLREIGLVSDKDRRGGYAKHSFTLRRNGEGGYDCLVGFPEHHANKIRVELDHFIPYLNISRGKLGPRSRQRSWYALFRSVFAEPLEDLKALLAGFGYLGSMRTPPRTLYNPVPVAPEDIGVSAEDAARLLYARRSDRVHYPPPLQIEGDEIHVPNGVRSRSLVDAMNDVLQALGVDASLRIEDL
ncbi:MAG TPA: AAA family ATPase, partial [Candidatus Nanopelagicales bacterium]|nr:AAA family ATPase [Candidatus Nanopelagicales bacterium]